MKKLSERWQTLFSGADPKSVVGQFPHPEWGDEIAELEAELAKEIESRDIESFKRTTRMLRN